MLDMKATWKFLRTILIFSFLVFVVYTATRPDLSDVPIDDHAGVDRYKIYCLEPNVCQNYPRDRAFVYKNLDNFEALVDADIDTSRNILHDDRVVPNVVHYTWYGGHKGGNIFRFHHFISVLSVHKIVRPNRIYFWHDILPTGFYWQKIVTDVPELYLIYRKPPTEIRGQKVRVPEHVTDVVRLEVMLEFGGMYFDLDVIILKPLDGFFRYDVTMGYEKRKWLCNGVIIGKPWADFFKLWHKKSDKFQDDSWNYHSVVLPGELAEAYPNLIHTENRSFHRPNHLELESLYGEGKLVDWGRTNYVCHLWIRFHNVEHNPRNIKTWNTTVGEIFRYIYYGSKGFVYD